MRAGLLTEVIRIQRPITVSSDYANGEVGYEDYIATKARIVHLSGKRTEQPGRMEAMFSVQFTIRLYHKVEYGMIVIHDGVRYLIQDINKDNKRASIIITAEVWNE